MRFTRFPDLSNEKFRGNSQMKIESDIQRGVRVISVRGSIDHENIEELSALFEFCIANGQSRIVLNLREAAYLDSNPIGMLIKFWKRARGRRR